MRHPVEMSFGEMFSLIFYFKVKMQYLLWRKHHKISISEFSLHKGKIFGVIFLTTLVQFIWIQVIFCLSLQLWIWNKSEEKCSIGQRFMCTKVTSYKIHILIIEQVQNNLSVIQVERIIMWHFCFYKKRYSQMTTWYLLMGSNFQSLDNVQCSSKETCWCWK